MINLILRKLYFFVSKTFTVISGQPLQEKHELLLNSCVFKNTGTPKTHNMRKFIYMINHVFRKPDISSLKTTISEKVVA